MAAGSDPKHPVGEGQAPRGPASIPAASSLLERWRTAAAPAEPPRARPSRPPPAPVPAPTAPPPAPRPDPVALLARIEAAVAELSPPAAARAALTLLAPIRDALGKAAAERDPAALTVAFEQIEDLLEALILVPSPPAAEP